MDKLLYEQPGKYKCFLQDSEVHFALTVGGDTLSYTLSGHPYAPTFIAKCDDDTYSYSEEGGLWFPKDTDSDWSGFCDELADKLKKNYYAKRKTFDEKILEYKENDKDENLSKIAELIIGAYNGSYKPPIIQVGVPMYVKHTPEGYSLITSVRGERIKTTDEHINDFVEHVYLVLAGNPSVKWGDVCKSNAVIKALGKFFDLNENTTIELSSGNGEYYPTSTILVTWKGPGDMHKEMKSKGFTYFDRNLWVIEL